MTNPLLFKHQTTRDFIQNRVNIEAYLEVPDYPRPLLAMPIVKNRKIWTPVTVAAMAWHIIKANLP